MSSKGPSRTRDAAAAWRIRQQQPLRAVESCAGGTRLCAAGVVGAGCPRERARRQTGGRQDGWWPASISRGPRGRRPPAGPPPRALQGGAGAAGAARCRGGPPGPSRSGAEERSPLRAGRPSPAWRPRGFAGGSSWTGRPPAWRLATGRWWRWSRRRSSGGPASGEEDRLGAHVAPRGPGWPCGRGPGWRWGRGPGWSLARARGRAGRGQTGWRRGRDAAAAAGTRAGGSAGRWRLAGRRPG
jgi:hypothetical protein